MDDWDDDEYQNYYKKDRKQAPQPSQKPYPQQAGQYPNYAQQQQPPQAPQNYPQAQYEQQGYQQYPEQTVQQGYPQGQYQEQQYNPQQYPQQGYAQGSNAPPQTPQEPMPQYKAPQYQQPPSRRAPPKSNKKWIWIGVISAIVAVAIIVAALFVVPYFMQSPIVGKWYITQDKVYYNENSESYNINEYWVFNASGSGYMVGYEGEGSGSYHWKDLGNNKVELTFKGSSYSIKIDYKITGDSITLTMYLGKEKHVLSGTRVDSVPHGLAHSNIIYNWQIYVNGEQTKVIKAISQTDGSATWSGTVTVSVQDQNGHPLPNVKVLLDGCGITAAGMTDETGEVELSLVDVTLPSGVTSDTIKVTLLYNNGANEDTKTDTITVIRTSGESDLEISDWEIYIDGNLTKNIEATTQSDGSAQWSGEFKIVVYDQNYDPLQGVSVALNGCGISMSGTTDYDGTLTLHLYGVTLPSGVSSDTINVTLQYNGQENTDSLTVIRSS